MPRWAGRLLAWESITLKREPRTQQESSETRGRIIGFINSHPGVHLRQIRRELRISVGMTQYHVNILEREGKVVSSRRSLFRRFFPSLTFDERDELILSALLCRTERDILLYLIRNPGANQKEVSAYMRISAASVSWHVKRLKGSGLVRANRDHHFVRYFVAPSPKEILRLLRSYHPDLWDQWAENFENILREL